MGSGGLYKVSRFPHLLELAELFFGCGIWIASEFVCLRLPKFRAEGVVGQGDLVRGPYVGFPGFRFRFPLVFGELEAEFPLEFVGGF